ncbi:hypothetical protein QQ045_002099 [Rhodiola kirilowii]
MNDGGGQEYGRELDKDRTLAPMKAKKADAGLLVHEELRVDFDPGGKLTMDKSWMGIERGDLRYIQGLVDFVDFAKQNGEKTHLCLCRKCLLVRGRISTKEMFVHLINNEDGDSESIMAYERYNNLVGEAQTLLYKSCDHTVLETILRAMQMKVESRLSDKGFDKMLHNTKKILPPDNNYPGSYKDVNFFRNMGLGNETIHACVHGCVSYYKVFKDHLSCSMCGEARYTQCGSKSKVPKKTEVLPLDSKVATSAYVTPYCRPNEVARQ